MVTMAQQQAAAKATLAAMASKGLYTAGPTTSSKLTATTQTATQIQAAQIKATTGSAPSAKLGTPQTTAQKIANVLNTVTPTEQVKMDVQQGAAAIFQKLQDQRNASRPAGEQAATMATTTAATPVEQTGTNTYNYAPRVLASSTVPLTTAAQVQQQYATNKVTQNAATIQAAKQNNAMILSGNLTTGSGQVINSLGAALTTQQISQLNTISQLPSSTPASADKNSNSSVLGNAMLLAAQNVAAGGLPQNNPQLTVTTQGTTTPGQNMVSAVMTAISQFITQLGPGVQSRISAKSGRF